MDFPPPKLFNYPWCYLSLLHTSPSVLSPPTTVFPFPIHSTHIPLLSILNTPIMVPFYFSGFFICFR